MMWTIIVLTISGVALPPAFRDHAVAALRGDFGPLPAWKRAAYQHALVEGVLLVGRAKRTTYCPHCDPSGICADGTRPRRGVCAASRNIPMHAVVWLATDGLLVVHDRGGAVRVGRPYTRPGETANFDIWVWRCPGGCWHGSGTKRLVPFVVICRIEDLQEAMHDGGRGSR